MSRFVNVQIKTAIKTSRSIIIGVVIQDVMFVRIATVSMSICSVLVFPVIQLICGIPSGASLVFKVFTCRVPVLFRTPLQIARDVDVFALSREFICVTFTMLLTNIVVMVRQTRGIYGFVNAHLLVLCNTYFILIFSPYVTLFRIQTMSNFISW